jgi:hypothetical protein
MQQKPCLPHNLSQLSATFATPVLSRRHQNVRLCVQQDDHRNIALCANLELDDRVMHHVDMILASVTTFGPAVATVDNTALLLLRLSGTDLVRLYTIRGILVRDLLHRLYVEQSTLLEVCHTMDYVDDDQLSSDIDSFETLLQCESIVRTRRWYMVQNIPGLPAILFELRAK